MTQLGFDHRWVKWIMECVKTVSYEVLINGSPYGQIHPTRGLRQGDPLSPYLFLFCAEVLSQMLSKAECERRLHGIKLAMNGPSISHLLFADDSLFFCRSTTSNCEQLALIFKTYEEASGQKINFTKSSVIFGMKTPDSKRRRLQRILGITRVGGGGKYLGLPEQFGRKKVELFQYIVQKVKNRTEGWSNKYLSPAGKEILIYGHNIETRNHLFFSCPFSAEIWYALAKNIYKAKFSTNWSDLITSINGQWSDRLESFIARYVFHATLHTIWRERNRRRHGENPNPPARLINWIDKQLPITICNEINSVISSFWWGKENGKKKIPWVAWQRLSIPKKEGGLGFKDLQHFNKALLAKQAWRILMNPTSLLARLYKSLYYPHTTYLRANSESHASLGWRSIQEGKALLQQGLRVRIGDGKTTRIWEDPWLPTLPPRPASGPILDAEMTVADLWKANKREWDPVVFEGVLNPEDQQLARELYLSQFAENDTYEWAYTQSAQYTVRSGYWVATHLHLPEDEIIQPPKGSIPLKNEIWKLCVAPKIQHFLWRCLSEALPTTTQLITRNVPADPTCQRCCLDEETTNHLLFMCPHAQAVWRCANIDINYHITPLGDFEDNLRKVIEMGKIQSLPLFNKLLPFWIMWRIWKSRNDFLFQKINRRPESTAQKGIQDVKDWIGATQGQEEDVRSLSPCPDQPMRRRTRNGQWSPPPTGWLKCNFDSGFLQERSFTNTGWIFRDCRGQVILSGCARLQPSVSALQAEAFGFLHVLQVAWSYGFRHVWFEGDNLELTNLINKGGDRLNLGTVLYDIRVWTSKIPYSSLGHVTREKNAVADRIARQALEINELYHVFNSPPSWLIHYLYNSSVN
ncbi:Ribonuclease H-like superfamily [Arabidopsis suecica]|uniref:Ribonuclease H-like superfamily n=1 Tax=Arabidopsis suecica TaxID=45249 RepID=A0A8T2CWT2_ARASU|nr:Ribonuclease H-like superfamily [Arabidopsis suecica]